MQMLHPFEGSVQAYGEQLADPDRSRPAGCPLCGAKKALIAHGFYRRTLVAEGFDGWIRVRRYLCRLCQRTVSLLPEFVLPYVRFAISLIGRYLEARLLEAQTLGQAAGQAGQEQMPYQRGQGWVARFSRQARLLSASLVALTRPVAAPEVVSRALRMLQSAGWIRSHRFLFSQLRVHLLGWPRSLAPDGRSRQVGAAESLLASHPPNTCVEG